MLTKRQKRILQDLRNVWACNPAMVWVKKQFEQGKSLKQILRGSRIEGEKHWPYQPWTQWLRNQCREVLSNKWDDYGKSQQASAKRLLDTMRKVRAKKTKKVLRG